MPECESCDNVIIREISISYWDVVEEILNKILCGCAFCMLFMHYHAKYKTVKEVIDES